MPWGPLSCLQEEKKRKKENREREKEREKETKKKGKNSGMTAINQPWMLCAANNELDAACLPSKEIHTDGRLHSQVVGFEQPLTCASGCRCHSSLAILLHAH